MGDIGTERREVEFEPLPATPATPDRGPQREQPAAPPREPAPARSTPERV